jgi:hypothetical protein
MQRKWHQKNLMEKRLIPCYHQDTRRTLQTRKLSIKRSGIRRMIVVVISGASSLWFPMQRTLCGCTPSCQKQKLPSGVEYTYVLHQKLPERDERLPEVSCTPSKTTADMNRFWFLLCSFEASSDHDWKQFGFTGVWYLIMGSIKIGNYGLQVPIAHR